MLRLSCVPLPITSTNTYTNMAHAIFTLVMLFLAIIGNVFLMDDILDAIQTPDKINRNRILIRTATTALAWGGFFLNLAGHH